MAFHSRSGWRLKALVPPMFFHKPLRERQGSSRQQNGPPAFGRAPDNAVGAAAARATFSGAVHQPSGIPRVVPSKSRLLQPWLHCREDRHIFFPLRLFVDFIEDQQIALYRPGLIVDGFDCHHRFNSRAVATG